jgi:hypothetical protein
MGSTSVDAYAALEKTRRELCPAGRGTAFPLYEISYGDWRTILMDTPQSIGPPQKAAHADGLGRWA